MKIIKSTNVPSMTKVFILQSENSHQYILFSGLAHMKNIMLSPRATVSWIIRNKLEDAEKFVADHNLEAKCTTPDKLEAVYNDPRYFLIITKYRIHFVKTEAPEEFVPNLKC